jgi:exodeoxyribonuclease VII small subunit
VITQLEKGEITLEESFSLYQKGVERLKHCNRLLDTVEKKLQIVSADGEVREG